MDTNQDIYRILDIEPREEATKQGHEYIASYFKRNQHSPPRDVKVGDIVIDCCQKLKIRYDGKIAGAMSDQIQNAMTTSNHIYHHISLTLHLKIRGALKDEKAKPWTTALTSAGKTTTISFKVF
jgi:hypothetical protein